MVKITVLKLLHARASRLVTFGDLGAVMCSRGHGSSFPFPIPRISSICLFLGYIFYNKLVT